MYVHSTPPRSTNTSASEGAFTAGGGTRVWFTDTVYGAIEARMGWEPHARLSGSIGVAIR